MIDLHNLEIPILGMNCKVTEKKLKDDDGLFHADSFSIEISKTIKDQNYKLKVLAHEMGHAMIERLGMSGQLNESVEEILVDSFANVFMETFVIDPNSLEAFRIDRAPEK